MAVHKHVGSYETLDLNALWNNLCEDVILIKNPEPTRAYCSFSHIVEGYAAGYYGYQWSKVFAADMYFSRFEKAHLDPTLGKLYGDTIIARGGLYEMEDNLGEFLDREPNNEAYLRDQGLA